MFFWLVTVIFMPVLATVSLVVSISIVMAVSVVVAVTMPLLSVFFSFPFPVLVPALCRILWQIPWATTIN